MSLDPAGTLLGSLAHQPDLTQAVPQMSLSVLGAGHWILRATFDPWGAFASPTTTIEADNGAAGATGAPHAGGGAYVDIVGAGNAAGDLFLVRTGHGMAGGVERRDPSGAVVYQRDMPAAPMFTGARPDEMGNLYLEGTLQGSVDVGCGPMSGSGLYLARLDPSGQCVWSRPVGSAGGWPASDGVRVVGSFTGSLDVGCGPMTFAGTAGYVASFDMSGACQWSRVYPGASVGARVPASGGLLVYGPYTGTIDLGCGVMTSSAPLSSFVAQIDAAGACVWSRSFATMVTPSLSASSTDVLLTASIASPVDFGGGPVPSPGPSSLALARLDGATGAHLASASFGGPSAGVSGQAVPTADGGALLDVDVQGSVDFGGGAVSIGTLPTNCLTDLDCHGGICLPLGCQAPSMARAVVRLDSSLAFRWQRPWAVAAPDACGATVVATPCKTCGPAGAMGVTVERIAF